MVSWISIAGSRDLGEEGRGERGGRLVLLLLLPLMGRESMAKGRVLEYVRMCIVPTGWMERGKVYLWLLGWWAMGYGLLTPYLVR
jgi:hypothetical protein